MKQINKQTSIQTNKLTKKQKNVQINEQIKETTECKIDKESAKNKHTHERTNKEQHTYHTNTN